MKHCLEGSPFGKGGQGDLNGYCPKKTPQRDERAVDESI